MIRFFFKKKAVLTGEELSGFKSTVKGIVKEIALKEAADIKDISFIFCSDKYIRNINVQYLGHDYETDIITFHDEDEDGRIESDIFISIETVAFNSVKFKTSFINELYRVIIHGILHLCGYKDKSSGDRKIMKRKENQYLKSINNKCRKK